MGNGVDVNAAAVSVISATTVDAAEVRTASTSGVGSTGVAGAHAARINMHVSAMMDSFVFMMVPLFLCFLVRVYSTVIQRYTSGPK